MIIFYIEHSFVFIQVLYILSYLYFPSIIISLKNIVLLKHYCQFYM